MMLRAGLTAIAVMVAAPAFAQVPQPSWTGCFVGGNVGYAWGGTSFIDAMVAPPIDLGGHSTRGVIGGGQIGCDYQSGPWVFGVQGMLDAASLDGSHVYATFPAIFNLVFTPSPLFPGVFVPGASESLTTHIPWLATLTARAGFLATPSLLLFVRGGAAWARSEHTVIISTIGTVGVADVTRSGWTLGAGGQYRFNGPWSLFAEYDYLHFGTEAVPFSSIHPIATNATAQVTQNLHLLLVGFNYQFLNR